ncbi:MAG TPA: hypothetical protein VGF32_09700 [Streptosporangiaceae bacterium]|jgi:hypothetical protein
MKTLRLLGAAAVAAWLALGAAPAHATGSPAITGIAIDSQACANVCFQLAVENPAAGTITLKLNGHRPGPGDWVDTGAPHVTVTIVAGQATYRDCFGDVSSFIAGKGFNSLRVEVASSTVPGLDGTTTKSGSFTCTGGSGSGGGSGGGGSGGGGSGGGGSGGSGSGAGSGSGSGEAAALAPTGGFDYRLLLAGVAILVAGLALLFTTIIRPAHRR